MHLLNRNKCKCINEFSILSINLNSESKKPDHIKTDLLNKNQSRMITD